jgi:uncharacterized OB-fold protein
MKRTAPAIEGLFTVGDEPCLLGSRCVACGTYFFPREKTFCKNPRCRSRTFEELPLSRSGTLWSFTNAGYKPPEPFIAASDPFVPFAIAAVELEREKLCVLGMVTAPTTVADLRVGMEMELVVDTLYEDAETRYLTWKWKPRS